VETGKASFYADLLHGRLTANGERYDKNAMTAAHRSLPFGTRITVTNLTNGKQVTLRVNDRGPFVKGRIVDVSKAAAKKLGMLQKGVVNVRLDIR
jgi:rare lipoprotein A